MSSDADTNKWPDLSARMAEFSKQFEERVTEYTKHLEEITENSTAAISKLIEEKITESEDRMRQIMSATTSNPDAARLLKVKELNKRYFNLSEALALAQMMADANQRGQAGPDDILRMVERAQPIAKFLPEGLQ